MRICFSMIKKIMLIIPFLCGLSLQGISLHKNVCAWGASLFTKRSNVHAPQVAVISIDDNISFSSIEQQLKKVVTSPVYEGLLLLVDSGGGRVSSFSIIHDMIKKVEEVKPVVCLVESAALSCGYLIASASSYIIAHSLSEIGSIGIIQHIKRYKNAKIKEDGLEADMHVDLLYVGACKHETQVFAHELTPEQRAAMQADLEYTYDKMVDMVAKNRKLERETCTKWAEGKMFVAPQALELGLIDSIGTIFEAEKKIRELIVAKNPDANYAPGVTLSFC